MPNFDQSEAVSRFSAAVGNLSAELLSVGVQPAALAAGLRIEAGKIEAAHPAAEMPADERELVQLAGKVREFMNTLQIAGIEERAILTCLVNAAAERMARRSGTRASARWLTMMAAFVAANGQAFEAMGQES